MTKESKENSEVRTWDVRNLERALKRGQLSRKDYDKYLKSLPDSKDKAMGLTDRGHERDRD